MINDRKTNNSPSTSAPGKRRIPPVISCLGCLLLGAAGLGGAVTLEARAAGAESAPPPAATKPPADARPRRASGTKEHAVPDLPDTDAVAPSVVTVPDFKGKRLSVAMRQARKLGLVLVASGADGNRIPPEGAADYRVRRQETPANVPVEPGTTIEVRVRESVGVAEGY